MLSDRDHLLGAVFRNAFRPHRLTQKLITWGSILWGIFTIAFGMTHYLRESIYNDIMLIGVTIVAADTIMSFFGSMANDAGYNAWYADMMDDSNSGQIGAVAATCR